MVIEWGAILGGLNILKDLADKYNDPKFNEAHMDLQMKIIDLQQNYIRITDECEQLRKAKEISAKVRFERPYVYFEGDKEPYCQRCFDKDGKLIHVGERQEWHMGPTGRMCPACEHIGEEK